MPELQSCYFCGEIGDALTAFDVVPADLADESSQRTVVVCSTCHRKLDTLLGPLRDLAVGGEPDADAVAEADDTVDATETDDTDAESPLAPSDWADDTEDAGTAETDHSADEQIADEQTTHDQREDEQDQSSADSSEITFAEGASESEDASSETDTTDEGIAFSDVDPERTDGTEDAVLGSDDSVLGESDEETTDDSERDATADSEQDTTDDSEAETDESDSDPATGPSDDPPTGYRKVVRLLQNRAFPVERASFVDLASNAYELEESDVSDSLDRLVERGALVESDGQLQKP